MAKRPIKKRMQRKVVETKNPYQKVKDLVERNFVQDPTPDPFEIAAPKGKAYQWASIHPDQQRDFDAYKRAGWRPVPASRHPDFPADRGRIIFGGSMLLEMPRKKYDKLVGADITRANKQKKDQDDLLGRQEGNRISILRDDEVISEAYEHPVDDRFEDVSVSITMRIPWRWRDAAACMKLSSAEYARRRLIMYSHGHSGGLLIPIEPPKENGWDLVPQYEMVPFKMIERAAFQFKRGK